ncbi:hypothetical protein [Microterricola pindariensis]|uniref:hypothetical protein n=1 Tax=Microterricola pindariensis TaxID=478010 RepID=UPI0010570AF3|nr:hypothetical protein [Microterricola pindariensis]
MTLTSSLRSLEHLLIGPEVSSFKQVRSWTRQLLDTRLRVAARLLALQPFQPFDVGKANSLLDLINRICIDAAAAVDSGNRYVGPSDSVRAAAEYWDSINAGDGISDLWRTAFNVPSDPVDERGEFRPEWVLQHYAYRNTELLDLVVPHLQSLGVPFVTDPLVGVSIVGWVIGSEDPVLAYISMRSSVDHCLQSDSHLYARIATELESKEPALRRSRDSARRALAIATSAGESAETRAAALAEAYKRILEGPFRQHSWAVFCLIDGEWTSPPTLFELRQRLASVGGLLGAIADEVVFSDLRNGEAHETWMWDGFAEEFVTELGRISLEKVSAAVAIADSFARGCEAGFAAVRSLDIQNEVLILPDPSEAGRMASWRRAQAFFGTNRLHVIDAQLNARDASIRLESLATTDINPCFQALILSRRLIPKISTFSVSTSQDLGPVITVSAEALDATMPVWEFAVSSIDQMPLSTFLPANFDARRRIEPGSVAARSAAWIAVDDSVDALDGSPAIWGPSAVTLLDVRLRIVEMAIDQTMRQVELPNSRLESVGSSVKALRAWLAQSPEPNRKSFESHPALQLLRHQWERWGPVSRHPLVADDQRPLITQRQPGLRERPETGRYSTI